LATTRGGNDCDRTEIMLAGIFATVQHMNPNQLNDILMIVITPKHKYSSRLEAASILCNQFILKDIIAYYLFKTNLLRVLHP